jgi:NAD(P)-dependent dehydrogenase (short-subunit alcohol dehydrogenase family)
MVVVITGASSGLGRATAYQLAEHGCRLVLAARRVDELEKTAQGCRERGGEAMVVETDVTSEDAVKRLVAAAIDRWGRIDLWINNAGVTLFARIEEGDLADHRRVIETNLFGAIHGARAVVPVFRRQRSGTMINVASVLSKVGNPFVPSYTISKFGLAGLSEALRVELAEHPDIHVCTLYPYAIDTPHFEDGANALGLQASAMPPMQSPEAIARALVGLARRPRRHRFVPRIAVLGLAAHWMFPRLTERLLLRALWRFHLGRVEPTTDGNLFEPASGEATVHGHRPPRVSTPAFVLWSAREILRIGIQAAREQVQRWREANTTQ